MIDFRQCEGVIFDLDGTLIDSMWVWEQIDYDFLGKRGIAVPEDYVDIITPMGFEQCADYTIDRFGLKETKEQVMDEWHQLAIEAYSSKVRVKDGVSNFLNYLKENEVKMSIATANSMDLIEPALRNNGIEQYFHNITTLSEVNRGKEFPDIYDLSAKRMDVNQKKCVVFEDIIEGITSAKSGGYTVVGVYDKRSETRVPLLKKAADYFIYDYNECIR